jgi:hypothetical protein
VLPETVIVPLTTNPSVGVDVLGVVVSGDAEHPVSRNVPVSKSAVVRCFMPATVPITRSREYSAAARRTDSAPGAVL